LISIKKYLTAGRDADVLMEVLRVLLRGLKAQSMIGYQRDYSKLQTEIDGLEKRVEHLSASEILVSAGAMAKAIEEYSERTSRHISALTQELQRMLTNDDHCNSGHSFFGKRPALAARTKSSSKSRGVRLFCV